MKRVRANVLDIQTPEGIVFSLQLAGPVVRFLAWGVDFAAISTLVLIASYLFSFFIIFGQFLLFVGDWAGAAYAVIVFVINMGYNMALEWLWRGQTVGKWLFRLSVMDAQGLRLRFNQIIIRNLLRAADMLPFLYLVGGIASLLSRRSQRLGDLAANTIVVRTTKATSPNLDQILAGKYNSFRDYPHIEARLRQRISPDEARIALQALVRRDTLEPQARVELFAEIAAHFRTLAAFPEEATYAITDEQYVRNVVDAVFRPQPVASGVHSH
ncbi:MAG: RDD family protein [Candidatus Hydrogenedentes bacterium]|nr:RDD family protein [Candidatus Hydrogenedentota bacterium]